GGHLAAQLGQDGLAVGVLGADDRPRPAPDQGALVQPAADRLAAGADAVLLPQQQRRGGAGPAAAGQAEGAGRPRQDPGDDQGGPAAGQPPGPAAGVALQRPEAALCEAALPARHGLAAGVEQGGDQGPGVAVGQQQDDVGAEPHHGVLV